MNYKFYYGLFHWLVHYILISILIAVTNFHLVNIIFEVNMVNLLIPVKLLSNIIPISIPHAFPYYMQSNFVDLFIVYVLTTFVDWDHFMVFKKYGRKGIFTFATQRITYPVHNFFFLSLFGVASAFTAVLFSKELAIILLIPVVHLLWDMFEDVFIFRTTYRKWEKTWGIGSKDLEDMWKELEKTDKGQAI
ncbi:hypothetical protein EPN87_02765 [archaeon]|nr:MAG: hypothetical protein EPN87_02765 [archaeon]